MDPTYPGVSSQFWLLIPYFARPRPVYSAGPLC